MSQLSKRRRIRPSSTFLFYSDPHRLDDAHLRWWGWLFLVS